MARSKSTTSINNLAAGVLAVAFLVASCKMEVIDPGSQRTKLNDMQIGIAGSFASQRDLEIQGRIISSDPNVDSTYTHAGLSGSYKHFVWLADTSRRETLKVYYSLPVAAKVKSDTIQYTAMYKRIENRFALLLKTKSDSLVCLFGTLLPQDLAWLPAKAGRQNVRISSGNEAAASRVTDCGREGDFNTFFYISNGSANVKPAQSAIIAIDERVYHVVNVANTSFIKNTNSCPETVGEFAYIIVQQ